MRLHELQMTAFGPFPGTETVDFDSLSDCGLFLLSGPMGAGKTSVLDAVCFGLYGDVPGDRNTAKHLRSDHAAAGVAPSVRLEVTMSGRRFRLHRSPAWTRAKRRGSGTTTEQARVNLEERADGRWVHLSNRLDETGHLVTGLVGMTLAQFCQVALLPQGRFEAFLRARSDERHRVLQQLFQTSRFEDIEKWLVRRRQRLLKANGRQAVTVAGALNRFAEAADVEPPPHWDPHDLSGPADDGTLTAWVADVRASAASALDEAEALRQESSARAEASRGELRRGLRLLELRAQHARARRELRTLDETADEARRDEETLDAARRAEAVAPLLRMAAEATSDAESARGALGGVLQEAAVELGSEAAAVGSAELATAEHAARESAAFARAFLPHESSLREARATVRSVNGELSELRQEMESCTDKEAFLPPEIVALRAEIAELATRSAALPALEAQEAALGSQMIAAQKLVDLEQERVAVRERLEASVHNAHALRDRMQDVREARINGIAAELASALASGDSCPVCGSLEHPTVARSVEGAPTRGDEAAARTAFEDADFIRQTNAAALTDLEQNCALTRQAAGGQSVEALRAELSSLAGRRRAVEGGLAMQTRQQSRLAALEEGLAAAQRRSAEVGVAIARLTEQREQAHRVASRVSDELAILLGQHEAADSVEHLIESQTRAGAAFARARELLDACEAADARADDALQVALESARAHGFDGRQQASAAQRSPMEIRRLEERGRAREAARIRLTTVLGDPDVQAAVAGEDLDRACLERAAQEAEDALAGALAGLREAERRSERLGFLQVQLDAGLAAWAPTRSAYLVTQRIATLVEGKGGDNALQMRLSAYVLAERLRQVVAAANERLSAMSGQRYLLEHSAVRGVGELRGGLSLRIRDEWTGEARDPATLSGGETFVTSLALALGLADVVSQEVGGANIDTLFVDEGFGSLDPETLDDVMDTLDGLRDGGRVIGVVSHVPEMRTRIPAQLQIRKTRSGSRLVAQREVP